VLQKRIDASGAKFKLNSIDQLIKGSSDYHPGILHDLVMKAIPTTSKPSKNSAILEDAATKIKHLAKSSGNIDIKERDKKASLPID